MTAVAHLLALVSRVSRLFQSGTFLEHQLPIGEVCHDVCSH